MSDEENKRLFEHYTSIINGNLKSSNPVRNNLNVSDAKRHLADLINKNPNLTVVEDKPVEEPKPVEKPKSKEKK